MKRSIVVVAAVFAVLAAACGSTVPEGRSTTSAGDGVSTATERSGTEGATELGAGATPTAGGQATDTRSNPAVARGRATTRSSAAGAPAGGGTAVAAATGPIQLGFVNTGVSNAAAFGVQLNSDLTSQQIFDALVAEMNKAGGINGRKIEPVYANTDTASVSWDADFQAACEKLTNDNKVAAVLGYVFVWLDAFEACLAKAGVVHLTGTYTPGDRRAQRDHPLLVSTTHPDLESAWLTGVGGAVTSGRLTPSNKLGILVDSCGHADRAFDAVVPSYLRAHKIPFEVFRGECSSGASDNGRAASDISAAALRFRSQGVDTVYVQGVPALLFSAHAESQGWRPSYIMNVAGAAFEGNVPASQLRNFHGYGWMPAVDVNPGHQPAPPNVTQKRCLSMLAARGLRPAGYNDYMLAYTSCDALFLYAAALKATNGRTVGSAVVPALTAIAPTLESASTYGGRVQVSRVQRGGAGVWREWGYTDACSCFTYRGPERALTW